MAVRGRAKSKAQGCCLGRRRHRHTASRLSKSPTVYVCVCVCEPQMGSQARMKHNWQQCPSKRAMWQIILISILRPASVVINDCSPIHRDPPTRQRAVKHTVTHRHRQTGSRVVHTHRLLCGRPRLCLDCLRAANLNNEHNENAIEYNRQSTATSNRGKEDTGGQRDDQERCTRPGIVSWLHHLNQPTRAHHPVCSFPCLALKLYAKNAAVKRAHVETSNRQKSQFMCSFPRPLPFAIALRGRLRRHLPACACTVPYETTGVKRTGPVGIF